MQNLLERRKGFRRLAKSQSSRSFLRHFLSIPSFHFAFFISHFNFYIFYFRVIVPA